MTVVPNVPHVAVDPAVPKLVENAALRAVIVRCHVVAFVPYLTDLAPARLFDGYPAPGLEAFSARPHTMEGSIQPGRGFNCYQPRPSRPAAQRARHCPLCAARIEPVNGESAEIVCSSCGLRFTIAVAPVPATSAPVGELDRWLAGVPMQPRPVTDAQLLWRLSRRRPVLSGLLAVTVASLAIAATVGLIGWSSAAVRLAYVRYQGQTAEQRCQRAEEAVAQLGGASETQRQQIRHLEKACAEHQAKRREADEVRRLTEQRCTQLERQRHDIEREVRQFMVQQLAEDAQTLLPTQPAAAMYLATELTRNNAASDSTQTHRAEQLLRDALGQLGVPRLEGHTGPVLSAVITPDGKHLCTGSEDESIRLWDLEAQDAEKAPVVLRGHHGAVTALAVSPDSQRLYSASHESAIMTWDLGGPKPQETVKVLRGHEGPVSVLTLSPDGRLLASGGGGGPMADCTVRLWDVNLPHPELTHRVLRGHDAPVSSVAISPNNRWVAAAGQGWAIDVWDQNRVNPAAEPIALGGHKGGISALAFTPDNRWLASASDDGTARLWDFSDESNFGRSIALPGHEGWLSALAVSVDGRWLATGGSDGKVRLWRLDRIDQPESIVLDGKTGRVRAISFTPDGRWLAAAGIDATARLWDLRDPNAPPMIFRDHASAIRVLAISKDGRWLATGGGTQQDEDYAVRLWDLKRSNVVRSARRMALERLGLDGCRQLLFDTAERSSLRR